VVVCFDCFTADKYQAMTDRSFIHFLLLLSQYIKYAKDFFPLS